MLREGSWSHSLHTIPCPVEFVQEFSVFLQGRTDPSLYHFLLDPLASCVDMDRSDATKPASMKTLHHYFNKNKPEKAGLEPPVRDDSCSQDIFSDGNSSGSSPSDNIPCSQDVSTKFNCSNLLTLEDGGKRKRVSDESSPNKRAKLSSGGGAVSKPGSADSNDQLHPTVDTPRPTKRNSLSLKNKTVKSQNKSLENRRSESSDKSTGSDNVSKDSIASNIHLKAQSSDEQSLGSSLESGDDIRSHHKMNSTAEWTKRSDKDSSHTVSKKVNKHDVSPSESSSEDSDSACHDVRLDTLSIDVRDRDKNVDSNSSKSGDENSRPEIIGLKKTPVDRNEVSPKKGREDKNEFSFSNKSIGAKLGLRGVDSKRNMSASFTVKSGKASEAVGEAPKRDWSEDSESDSTDSEADGQTSQSKFAPAASSTLPHLSPSTPQTCSDVAQKRLGREERGVEVKQVSERGDRSPKASVKDPDKSVPTKDPVDSDSSRIQSPSGVGNSSRSITKLEDMLLNGYEVNPSDRLSTGKLSLCLEDINSDDELYSLQCPKHVDVRSLVGRRISLTGESVLEGLMGVDGGGSVVDCESFAVDQSRVASYVTLLLPSRTRSSFDLGRFKVSGSVVISERLVVESDRMAALVNSDTLPTPTSHKKSSSCVTPLPADLKRRHPIYGLEYKSAVNAPNFEAIIREHRENLERGGDLAKSAWDGATKKKKKKKQRSDDVCHEDSGGAMVGSGEHGGAGKGRRRGVVVDRNLISLVSEDESNPKLNRKKKKRNKSVLDSDGDVAETQPTAKVLMGPPEEAHIVGKKKKKKNKERQE